MLCAESAAALRVSETIERQIEMIAAEAGDQGFRMEHLTFRPRGARMFSDRKGSRDSCSSGYVLGHSPREPALVPLIFL